MSHRTRCKYIENSCINQRKSGKIFTDSHRLAYNFIKSFFFFECKYRQNIDRELPFYTF